MVDSKQDGIELLEDALSAKAKISKLEKLIAVMFADLCDSTAYKLERGDSEGLLKTYRHNTIVIAAVAKAGGKVVKFIGDEVMATFDQEDACDHALEAALEIQKAIGKFNKGLSGAKDEEIASKIGINYGLALMIQFPGNEAQDPQGKVVDAAARIVSLTKPNQILCSESVKLRLSKTFEMQGPHHRAAKGILGGINVYEVVQEGAVPREPKFPRHTDIATDHIRALLNKARKTEFSGSPQTAAAEYSAILHVDPDHFAANYRLAYLGFKHKDKIKMGSGVLLYSQQAAKSRSDSGAAKAQHLVLSWSNEAREDLSSSDKSVLCDRLDRLIKEANDALEDCYDACDFNAEIVCLNLLAYYISERLSLKPDAELFKRAREVCDIINYRIEDFKSNLIPAFYETHAKLLCLSQEKSDLDRALALANESVKLRPTPRVYDTMSKILGKREQLD